MSELTELGPVLPSRLSVRLKARELRELAARAEEFAGTGPTADLGLAVMQLARMRAILGPAGTAVEGEPLAAHAFGDGRPAS